jgi:hypothetical protein
MAGARKYIDKKQSVLYNSYEEFSPNERVDSRVNCQDFAYYDNYCECSECEQKRHEAYLKSEQQHHPQYEEISENEEEETSQKSDDFKVLDLRRDYPDDLNRKCACSACNYVYKPNHLLYDHGSNNSSETMDFDLKVVFLLI